MTGGKAGPFDALQQQAIDAWQGGDMAGARKAFTLALKLAQDQGDSDLVARLSAERDRVRLPSSQSGCA